MVQLNAPWTYVEETGLLWYGAVGDTSIAPPTFTTLAEVIYLKEVQWVQINIIYAPQVPTPFKCLRCGKYFDSQEDLTIHIQTVEVPAYPEAHLCLICGWAFTYVADLETHMREAHPELFPISTSLALNAPPNTFYVGGTLTFAGLLTRNDIGVGVPNQNVYLYLSPDTLLSTTQTDADGNYELTWTPTEKGIYSLFTRFEGAEI